MENVQWLEICLVNVTVVLNIDSHQYPGSLSEEEW